MEDLQLDWICISGGDDCPYKCDAYDNWKRRAGEGEEDKHETDRR